MTDVERHRKGRGLRSERPTAVTMIGRGPAVPATRYRLDVIAPSVLDVVTSAGGWLFDHQMAGWDVTVMVCDLSDSRPLRILGVDAVELTSISWEERPRPHGLAIEANLFRRDERVRHIVFEALKHGLTDITVWGERWPEGLHRRGRVQHRLSNAGRAFKAHALAAACEPSVGDMADAETFQCGTIISPRASLREPTRQVASGG